jgi:NADH:ubiquinone oxidoreductase subunit 6 (subunit J)
MNLNTDQCANTGNTNAAGVASIQCLVPLFANVVRAVVMLGAVALFIMLLVGGFNFLFSAGDQKKLEAARGTVTQAIVGLVIMSLAYLIIQTIGSFTGVDLKSFSIPTLKN